MKKFTSVISSSRKINKSFWLVEAEFSDFVTQTEDFFFSLTIYLMRPKKVLGFRNKIFLNPGGWQ